MNAYFKNVKIKKCSTCFYKFKTKYFWQNPMIFFFTYTNSVFVYKILLILYYDSTLPIGTKYLWNHIFTFKQWNRLQIYLYSKYC